ncbi:MAG: hypothetical protein RLZZ283_12 [Candidatus Parcubacteria bacterium]|jgi:hypothetical protein
MRFTRLSSATRSRIIDCYITDIGATQAARLLSVNRKTINAWYALLRERMAGKVQGLKSIKDTRVFAGYHERRIKHLNGLFKDARASHLIESKLRYVLKGKFKKLVLKSTKDLLE